MPDTPNTDQAYEALESAIRATTAAENYDGLVTDWVVLAVVQQFTTDGHDSSSIVRLVPPDGRMPYYRMLGLLDYAHAGARNEIRDEASFMEPGDGDAE